MVCDDLNLRIKNVFVRAMKLHVRPDMISDTESLWKVYGLDAEENLAELVDRLEDSFLLELDDDEYDENSFANINGIAAILRPKLKHDAERWQVVAQIAEAFRNVQREDGVSLHEAEVIDDYGGPAERAAARASDGENGWIEVPDSDIARHYSIFPFLDAKGFRYYIPAYMTWTLKHYGEDVESNTKEWVVYALMLRDDLSSAEHYRKHFEMLNREQSRAVCAFLEFETHMYFGMGKEARAALDKYWGRFKS